MNVTYRSWSRYDRIACSEEDTLYKMDLQNRTKYSKKNGIGNLNEIACKKFHEERKVYYVTIFDNEKPASFLEINNTFLLVGFLDAIGRQYLQYVFYETKPGKIFLKDVTFWHFNGNDLDAIKSTWFYFEEDGSLRVEEMSTNPKNITIKKCQNLIDVSNNWDDYPTFGNYEKITKIERISPTTGST